MLMEFSKTQMFIDIMTENRLQGNSNILVIFANNGTTSEAEADLIDYTKQFSQNIKIIIIIK